ncbi:MAG TPA: V-type ATPase 116kDa subunit family protein [Syntrophorhabdaceae bacterium]|nr:V-type ATPase 116kDa subunit family protein [Syntrophorhabdaceae bacterium]
MFKPEPMVFLEIIILSSDERDVLKEIGRLNKIHLERSKSGYGEDVAESANIPSDLLKFEHLRIRIQELRQTLSIPPAEKMYFSKDMTVEKAEEILNEIDDKSKKLLEEKERLLKKQKEIKETIDRYLLYRGFDLPLLNEKNFTFLHFITGSIAWDRFDFLNKNLSKNTLIFPLSRQKNQQYLFIITTKEERGEIESLLEQAGFQKEFLPVVEKETIDGFLKKQDEELRRISDDIEKINLKKDELKVEIKDILDEIERFIEFEYKLISAGQKFLRTETTVVLSGWVPCNEIHSIEKVIKESTKNRYIMNVRKPDDSMEQEVPVLLKHPRILKPFEMLVSAYGLPSYKELEPTLFVAISYILMFGMMFGDVGHSFVLALCGMFALTKGKTKQIKDFGILLISAGISSMIFGVIYGSYFGIEALKRYAIWHDPIDCDPIKLMYFAISIGIVLISIGLILNALNHFKRGDVIGGILDKFGLIGIVFYWGAIVILIKSASLKAQGLLGYFLFMFIIIPIIGWAIKEPLEHIVRHKKGVHHKGDEGLAVAIMESFIGAFEAILSYLANTISFVRLAAYAMSHAALLFAAFMVAHELKGVAYVGGGLSLFIIVLGNFIAIVLEGVIASVQALRLEYYEFFGKFFSGSGRPFEPFYISIGEERRVYEKKE